MTVINKDPTIARKSFKITGSILSNNTVTIPDPNGEVKACNLIGRYVNLSLPSSIFNSSHHHKNTFAFISKSESEIGNQEFALLSPIWKKIIPLVVET